MKIVDGKGLAQEIKAAVKNKVASMPQKPMLACIIVEGDSASEIYVASKQRSCEGCEILSKVIRLPNSISQENLEKEIEKLNADPAVSAILLQLPLPKGLSSSSALNKISPQKDVDCLTNTNLGKLLAGEQQIAPCTASGIIKILDKYNIPLEGKRAVVIGRSLLVGKSVACLLEQRNCTVTLCHSRTKNLAAVAKQADILVVAIGKKQYVTADFVKRGAVVIDVGINRMDGKLYGDVAFDEVKEKAKLITPVPGGVGPLTVACLMENCLTLAENSKK